MGPCSLLRFASEDVRSNMYILLDGTQALVVDPHPAPGAFELLRKAGITNCTILLTHEHPDHISGVHGFQQAFRTELICHEACAQAIASPSNNHPAIVVAMLAIQDSRNGTNTAEHFRQNYEEHIYHADVIFKERMEWTWGQQHFSFIHTPGHTAGSSCIIWNDAAVFTGDSLLPDAPAITRLPGGSTKLYRTVTLPFLKKLPKDILVLPGHGAEFHMIEVYQGAVHVEFSEV